MHAYPLPLPELLSKSPVKQLEDILHIIKNYTKDCCRTETATKPTKSN